MFKTAKLMSPEFPTVGVEVTVYLQPTESFLPRLHKFISTIGVCALVRYKQDFLSKFHLALKFSRHPLC